MRTTNKRLILRVFRAFGLAVRRVGNSDTLGGIELLRDVNIALGKKEGMIVFDVGANVGDMTLEMLHEFRSPRITAFEPSPRTFRELQAHVGSRATLEQLAIAEARGTVDFQLTAGSVNDSVLSPVSHFVEGTTRVEAWPLDEYCESRSIATIDFLKVDTQGYDLRVLNGARRLLSKGAINAVSVELMFPRRYHGQPSPAELIGFFDAMPYKCLGFYSPFYLDGELSSCDVCFVANSART